MSDGLRLLLWQQEGFAYSDSYDEAAGRYRGLRGGQLVDLATGDMSGLLVRPEVALEQLEREKPVTTPSGAEGPVVPGSATAPGGSDGVGGVDVVPEPAGPTLPTRYHGTVALDPARTGRDPGRIADEVISHLVGLVGSDVTVTLEIEARVPSGVTEHIQEVVTQNGRDLKVSGGFESE